MLLICNLSLLLSFLFLLFLFCTAYVSVLYSKHAEACVYSFPKFSNQSKLFLPIKNITTNLAFVWHAKQPNKTTSRMKCWAILAVKTVNRVWGRRKQIYAGLPQKRRDGEDDGHNGQFLYSVNRSYGTF
ncbi:unnamed protein product [Camellia sinensis]